MRHKLFGQGDHLPKEHYGSGFALRNRANA